MEIALLPVLTALCVAFVNGAAPPVDQNPNCPRMASGGGCAQADVQKYCPQSCQEAVRTVEGLAKDLSSLQTQHTTENQALRAEVQAAKSSSAKNAAEVSALKVQLTKALSCCTGTSNEVETLENSFQTIVAVQKLKKTKDFKQNKKVLAVEKLKLKTASGSSRTDVNDAAIYIASAFMKMEELVLKLKDETVRQKDLCKLAKKCSANSKEQLLN